MNANFDMDRIMSELKKECGEQLKKVREELGLTVREVSEISKITKQTIYNAENGVTYSKKYVDFLSTYNNI